MSQVNLYILYLAGVWFKGRMSRRRSQVQDAPPDISASSSTLEDKKNWSQHDLPVCASMGTSIKTRSQKMAFIKEMAILELY